MRTRESAHELHLDFAHDVADVLRSELLKVRGQLAEERRNVRRLRRRVRELEADRSAAPSKARALRRVS